MNTNTSKDSNAKGKQHGADVGLQEKIMKQIRELGDSLERAGEKVEKNGWETIGQAIYKLGNRLEHLREKKTTDKAYTDREFDEKSKKSSDSSASANKVGGNDSQAY